MCMFSERLQILLTPQQRTRLTEEAKRRGTSVTALVREAIDKGFGVPEGADRRRAFESITKRSARFFPPDVLDKMIEGRFD